MNQWERYKLRERSLFGTINNNVFLDNLFKFLEISVAFLDKENWKFSFPEALSVLELIFDIIDVFETVEENLLMAVLKNCAMRDYEVLIIIQIN